MMVMRKVVEQVEVPYDRDIVGNPITRPMQKLECGHLVNRFLHTRTGSALKGTRMPPNENRDCKRCDKEASGG